MKKRNWATRQLNQSYVWKYSLKLTAILLLTASQLGDFVLAQPVPQTTTNPPILNTATYTYTEPVSGINFQGETSQLQVQTPLIDPFGRLIGCDGGQLPDYTGFSVGLFEPLNNLGDIGAPVALTATVPPNLTSPNTRAGVAPNFFNANPFFLTNSDQGRYSFLFDPSRGQIDVGRQYILAVKPPDNSALSARRLRITIDSVNGNIVSYTATSLDGEPISSTNGATSINGIITIGNAETVGLSLVIFNLQLSTCDDQAIQIVKTSDRAAAQSGDTVLYRLAARNLANTVINEPEIRDDLPVGFQYLENSVRAELGGVAVPVNVAQNGRTLTFTFPNTTLPPTNAANLNTVLNIVYAAQITNDALRGDGINRATLSGIRADNQQIVNDGPVFSRIRLQPGILSDCGTLIGRVFIDKNFDGEQQPGEPGVPNAVLFMDDGTRIVTDNNGLYSLNNVLSGSRTLAIDLTSIPGYTLAPNLNFIERNSQSRLVRLAPGSLGRVNFAVTPAVRDSQAAGVKP
jgi:uncharacterized repeat protein (TIGR01451 family)